ncbi:hypothetical protein ACQKO6_14670 [Pseudomonas monteilii]|uniref:hypothetical protein n=1 Tax=Pseudomonas alabamensis TaxID=3064349 RepID=UPI0027140B9C|nr:hypothetical protein [Pseudomonas sp. 22-AL-CL-001]MDO7909490.1 hypothetical protein [Pseudomonas sp. 22-AL-CL-001]
MDRCALEFMARRWWRRVEVWLIATLLLSGGVVLGYQAACWTLVEVQARQVEEIRRAYDTALGERDRRLDELARRTDVAVTKAARAATAASQAVDKADEALAKGEPDQGEGD